MKLSEKIVNLRKARNMSQEELAENLGVSRQAVSRWEVGSTLPDASNILQLSKLFGVSADYLLNDDYKGESPAPIKSKSVSSIAGTIINKIISLCVAGFGFAGNFVIYVLSRFIDTAEKYNIKKIIRVCADNPFLDMESLKTLIKFGSVSTESMMSATMNTEAAAWGFRW